MLLAIITFNTDLSYTHDIYNRDLHMVCTSHAEWHLLEAECWLTVSMDVIV